jgi:hypothetical protein
MISSPPNSSSRRRGRGLVRAMEFCVKMLWRRRIVEEEKEDEREEEE